MFVRCSIRCQCCDHVVSSVYTAKDTIPRRLLHIAAVTSGAVTDQAGRWYCNVGCRTAFRLTHNVATRQELTPTKS